MTDASKGGSRPDHKHRKCRAARLPAINALAEANSEWPSVNFVSHRAALTSTGNGAHDNQAPVIGLSVGWGIALLRGSPFGFGAGSSRTSRTGAPRPFGGLLPPGVSLRSGSELALRAPGVFAPLSGTCAVLSFISALLIIAFSDSSPASLRALSCRSRRRSCQVGNSSAARLRNHFIEMPRGACDTKRLGRPRPDPRRSGAVGICRIRGPQNELAARGKVPRVTGDGRWRH